MPPKHSLRGLFLAKEPAIPVDAEKKFRKGRKFLTNSREVRVK